MSMNIDFHTAGGIASGGCPPSPNISVGYYPNYVPAYPYWSVIPYQPPVQCVYPYWMVNTCEHCFCKDDEDDHKQCCKCIERMHKKFI